MAKLNFGGTEENVVTRDEFPLAKAQEVLKDEVVAEPEKDFNNAMGQESLTRFDQPRKNKNKNKNRNRNKAKTSDVAPNNATNERPKQKQRPQGKKPNIIQKKNEDKK